MSHVESNSPRISHLFWGHTEVEGHPPFKDAKVFPGGAREWDWRETGTRHVPGIQPADVRELIEHDAKAVVLSTAIWQRLQVCPETLELLAELLMLPTSAVGHVQTVAGAVTVSANVWLISAIFWGL